MKFSDFLCKEAINVDLEATDKPGVIRELLNGLTSAGQLDESEAENIFNAIMKREELGSTGIGRGIAIPHTKHASVKAPVGTIGVSRKGVEFQSYDGDDVHLFFLLISPPDRPGDHLRALENISKQLQDDTFCRFLKQSKSVEEIQQTLEEADNNQFVS